MKSRVLVCGGRNYDDFAHVKGTLDNLVQFLAPEFCIIQGGAKGADSLARHWAKLQGVCCITVPANWDCYDNKAGSIRNKWMLDFCKPDLVVSFPGGTGTAHMVKLAKQYGIDHYAA